MLSQYGYVGIFLVIAVLIPSFMLTLSWLTSFTGVRPQKPSVVKSQTYECGMETIGGSWVQFNFRYYYFALLFVIFDVETVFMYPWAVHFKQLALFGLVEMAIFVAILLVGYLYAWKKHAMEWR